MVNSEQRSGKDHQTTKSTLILLFGAYF